MRNEADADRVRGSVARRAGIVLAAVAGAGLLTASAAGGTPAGLSAGVTADAAGLPAAPRLAAAAAVGATVNCGGVTIGAGATGRRVADSERSGPAEAIAQVLRLAEWNRKSPYERATWTVVPATADTAMLIAHVQRHITYVPVFKRDDGHWQMGAPCPSA